MTDDEVKDISADEPDEEEAAKGVDFASLVDEEEPIEAADGANPDEVTPAVVNRKVDLDGDNDGWEYADEEEEEEEESYEDSHTD